EVTRSVLLKLLLAEEKMLGLTEQQPRRIDRHIAQLRQLISGQTRGIERLAAFGIDTEGHRLVLATLTDLRATYQTHRQLFTAAFVGKGCHGLRLAGIGQQTDGYPPHSDGAGVPSAPGAGAL